MSMNNDFGGEQWQLPDIDPEGKVLDQTIPMYLVTAFNRRLTSNRLIGGHYSTLSPVSSDLFILFSTPFIEWSPRLRDRTDRLSQVDVPACRFSTALSGMAGMGPRTTAISAPSGGGNSSSNVFAGLFNTAHHLAGWLDRDVSEMKTRMMMGVDPVSETCWQQRELNCIRRYDDAVDLVNRVINAGLWIIEDDKRVKMVYRDVREALEEFDAEVLEMVLAEEREENNTSSRDIAGPKFTDIWDEFYFGYLNYVLDKARAWAVSKLNAMIAGWLVELRFHSLTPQRRLTYNIKSILNEIAIIGTFRMTARYRLILFPDVFRKFNNSNPVLPYGGDMVDWTKYDPDQPLNNIILPLEYHTRNLVMTARTSRLVRQHVVDPIDISQIPTVIRVGGDATRIISKEVRGPMPEVHEEMWISALRSKMDPRYLLGALCADEPRVFDTWGFVGYRLGYKHSAEEWDTFRRKFADSATNWGGETVKGASAVKDSCRIRWLDGQDLGLEEGDLEGAKKHYNGIVDNERRTTYLPPDVFLVADDFSIASFLCDSSRIPLYLSHGAKGGHVTAIDTKYETPAPTTNPDRNSEKKARGYNGQIKIAAQSIFQELFPGLLVHGYGYLQTLWSDSMWHPHLVYSGPLTTQESRWYQALGITRWAALMQVLDMLKGDSTSGGEDGDGE